MWPDNTPPPQFLFGVWVLVAMVMFARRVAHFTSVTREKKEIDGATGVRYTVVGEHFFASSNDLTTQFEYSRAPDQVVIDL